MIVIRPSKVQIMSLITNILAYKTSEADLWDSAFLAVKINSPPNLFIHNRLCRIIVK